MNIGSTTTLKAVAIAPGFSNSGISTGIYTIETPTDPPAETPTFSPVAGSYESTQSVTISSATVGASIYYTADGSTPDATDTLYSAPISVSSTQTIKAIAIADGYSNSAIGSATYTITAPGGGTATATSATAGTVNIAP